MRADQMPKPWPMAESEAMPCPFCGSRNVSDGEVLSESDGKTWVQSQCMDCEALGPAAETDDPDYGDTRAIAAWNRRAS